MAETENSGATQDSLGASRGYAKLTECEREVLDHLRERFTDKWARPMDVGGRDASHHSRTLAKLVKLGFAESRYRGWLGGGSKLYRALSHTATRMSGQHQP